MNWDKAIELLEKGQANAVITQVILLAYDGRVWLSFDGKEWDEVASALVKREVG